ncbi:MAG: hypothetical protein IIC78_06240 [Chloroflexi bacterium]|nr:hypothetical protein [Chloroflexota bacterium]
MTELYIATGKSFAHLTENGDKWRVRTALEGKGIRSIAVDPANADVVYAGSAKYGLWKSLDRGLTWHALELPESYVYSIAVSPVDGTLYVGTEPSRLFKSMDGGEIWEELSALRSIPSAPTWSFPPKPWTSHVRWIAPNPQDPQLLLVGIELGRVMYSNDGGETWEDHRPGAVKDAHELAWHPSDSNRAYEVGGGGAAWSFDGGKAWKPSNMGRDRHYVWALAVDPSTRTSGSFQQLIMQERRILEPFTVITVPMPMSTAGKARVPRSL